MNIENKQIASFFQVSVNTDKLNQFFAAVTNALGNHDKQIQQINNQLSQIRINFQEKLVRIKNEFDYEKQRADKKRKDDDTFFHSLVHDSTSKQQKLANQAKNTFLTLSEEIKVMKAQPIEQLKLNQLKCHLQKFIETKQSNMESQIATISQKIKSIQTQIKNSSSTQDFLLKNMIDAYQNKGKVDTDRQKQNTEQTTIILKPNRHYTTKDASNKDKLKSIVEQAAAKEAKERKKRKADQRRELQNLQYASVSAKIDSLDLRITAKENESLNKVMWAGKISQNSSQPSQKDLGNSMDRIEMESKNLQQRITTKLEHIQQIIEQKIGLDDKELLRIKGRCDLLSDQMEINIRRIQKESGRITDCMIQNKKNQEKRIDQKVVDNFIMMFKRQLKNMEEQIELRLRKDEYQKQQTKLTTKFQIYNQTVSEKAQKEEVKRAFRFIEDKIKEIVLIMAEEQQADREGGAGKKIPYKCLSCDKQLQSSMGVTQRPHLQTRLASRGSTSNLRKRIRVGNNGQEK